MEDIVSKLHIDLCNVLNSSSLNMSVKYFVLKDIFNEVEKMKEQYIQILAKQPDEQESLFSEEHVSLPFPIQNLSNEAKEKWEEFRQIINKEQQKQKIEEEENSSSSND